MKLESLHDLYIQELRDLYDAEQQIIKALPKMIDAAESEDLRDALSAHLTETEGHVTRLERVFEMHGEDAQTESCDGIEGIIDENKDLLKHDENVNVRDAAIIAGAQKVEHYEIASYGSLCAWAKQMGHTDALNLLKQTLAEEKRRIRN